MTPPNKEAIPEAEPYVVGSDGVIDSHEPLPHERMPVPSSQTALTTPPAPIMIDAAPF